MHIAAQALRVINPKRKNCHSNNRQDWYSFYAGFSLEFATAVISSAALPRKSLILDPWNGTGTSALAAAMLGHRTLGVDLNPAMVVIARAKLMDANDVTRVCDAIPIIHARRGSFFSSVPNDPLGTWFSTRCIQQIRGVEKDFRAISPSWKNGTERAYGRMPGTIAFFYVALFKVVRSLLQPFLSSNPTWVRTPQCQQELIEVKHGMVRAMFMEVCASMIEKALEVPVPPLPSSKVNLASAESLPLEDNSVDLIVTSPPYCTRIDYAVATKPELAVLGYGGHRLRALRHALTGTLTVNGFVPLASPAWGPTCTSFLSKVRSHPSKASGTYYLRTHLQYFDSIKRSVSEIGRVLRSGSRCIVVVQDSYYKNVRNDLPVIFTEMAELSGLKLVRRDDFQLTRIMARINPRARKYRQSPTGVESVLCFVKP